MTELRRDPVIGRWVIISTERGKRPSDFGQEVETGVGKFCPFCPGRIRGRAHLSVCFCENAAVRFCLPGETAIPRYSRGSIHISSDQLNPSANRSLSTGSGSAFRPGPGGSSADADGAAPVSGINDALGDQIETSFAHVLADVAHCLMTIEAMSRFGWPATGLAARLRKHHGEIPKLHQYQQALVRLGQIGLQPVPPGCRPTQS